MAWKIIADFSVEVQPHTNIPETNINCKNYLSFQATGSLTIRMTSRGSDFLYFCRTALEYIEIPLNSDL